MAVTCDLHNCERKLDRSVRLHLERPRRDRFYGIRDSLVERSLVARISNACSLRVVPYYFDFMGGLRDQVTDVIME
jgi:hypothetical protein